VGFFYISHYSVTEINPFHDENTTEQVNWYFSSAVVSSWKGLTFIIRVCFPRYSVEIIVEKINICVLYTFQININVRHIKPFKNMFHDIAWKSSWKRLICRVHHTYINLCHDDVHAISCSKHIGFFFYISHYSVTEINPFHDENSTEQVNWYFSSAVVSSWKGLTFIIRVFFPRYIVEHISSI
jgi:hypothetical protein